MSGSEIRSRGPLRLEDFSEALRAARPTVAGKVALAEDMQRYGLISIADAARVLTGGALDESLKRACTALIENRYALIESALHQLQKLGYTPAIIQVSSDSCRTAVLDGDGIELAAVIETRPVSPGETPTWTLRLEYAERVKHRIGV